MNKIKNKIKKVILIKTTLLIIISFFGLNTGLGNSLFANDLAQLFQKKAQPLSSAEQKMLQRGEIYQKLNLEDRKKYRFSLKSEQKDIYATLSDGQKMAYLTLSDEQKNYYDKLDEDRQVFYLSISSLERELFPNYLADKNRYFSNSSKNEIVFDNGQKPKQSVWLEKVPYKETTSDEDIWTQVAFYYKKQVENYLSLADINKPTPIKIPIFPKAEKLYQGERELNAEFVARVQKENKKKDVLLRKIKTKYANKVEIYNEKITKRNALSSLRKKELQQVQNVFLTDAVVESFQELKFSEPDIDKESGSLYIRISNKNSNYKDTIAFNSSKLTIKQRNVIFDNPEQLIWTLGYKIDEKKQISVNYFSVAYKKLSARSVDEKNIQINQDVLVAEIGGNTQLQVLELQDAQININSGDLIDSFYKDGSRYQDDLAPRIKKLQKAPEDKNFWLFVIGIEKYKKFNERSKTIFDIDYATRSAELFTELMQKKYGIRKTQTVSLINETATTTKIKEELELMLSKVDKNDTILFYYNGHGIPVKEGNFEPYFLPIDKDVNSIAKAKDLQFKAVYSKLEQSKAKKVIAFIDSCFAGADGKSLYKGTAAVAIPVKGLATEDFQKTTILTAGTSEEFSNVYSQKGHRLFSYFVMKELLESKSDITDVDALHRAVSYKVNDTSNSDAVQNEQTPQIQGKKGLSF